MCAVELFIWMGVDICGWPSSSSILRIDTAVLALMNSAPSLAFAAEDITALIICNMLSTAPLLVGIFSCPAMNMCPPSFWFGQIGGVTMDRKYHVAGFVCENCIFLGWHLVEELKAFLHGCFCWGSLFGCKGTEGGEHCSVNCLL